MTNRMKLLVVTLCVAWALMTLMPVVAQVGKMATNNKECRNAVFSCKYSRRVAEAAEEFEGEDLIAKRTGPTSASPPEAEHEANHSRLEN